MSAPASPEFEVRFVETAPGVEVALRLQRPAESRAIVHILHGLTEHSGRYRLMADVLCQAGFIVAAHDHRGHGRTVQHRAPSRSFGHDGWQGLITDVVALQTHLLEQYPHLPLFVVGHSMGSVAALTLATDPASRAAGTVLISPPLQHDPSLRWARAALDLETRLRGRGRPSWLFAAAGFRKYNQAFTNPRTDFDWLADDPETVDQFIEDPDAGWPVTTDVAAALTGAIIKIVSADSLIAIGADHKFLLVAGDNDPVSDHGRAVHELDSLLRASATQRVTTKIIPGGRHEPHGDRDRQNFFRIVTDWLDAALEDELLRPRRGGRHVA